jgi:polysaccharide biosynthesis protein VpsM
MKQNITRVALLAACLGVTAKAAPFMAVGDNAELFVTATASLQFDDNIFLDSTGEVDDTIWSLTPGVDLVFGKNSVTKGNLYYREEIRRFADNGTNDTELSNVGFNTAYDNGVTKANFNASYAQTAQNDALANGVGFIVRREVTSLAGKVEFGLSEKTSVGTGISFASTDYASAGFSDSDVWTLPIDVYYKYTEKLAWSLGYRYRSTELSGAGTDYDDHFLSVGARGEFTPKLTGQLRVGLTQRSLDVGGDDTLFGLDGSLTYAFSEKTSYSFTASNEPGNSGTGDANEIFSLGLNASNKLSEQWTFNAGLTYRNYDYANRTEDYLEGLLSVGYKLNNYVDFNASYTYRNNETSAAGGDFTGNVFALGANVRY